MTLSPSLSRIALLVACAWMTSGLARAAEPTLMLRQPAVSKDNLAFVYAGDLWLAAGRPQRRQCPPPHQPCGQRVRAALLSRWPPDRLFGQL